MFVVLVCVLGGLFVELVVVLCVMFLSSEVSLVGVVLWL